MKRLTAYISGQIQKVGYRSRVIDMARLLGLKGTIQNLSDGRVKIIAEGEENDLERFLNAINIKNTIIRVSDISKEYSEAISDFEDFYKQVGPGETDSRLDQAVVVLKDILDAVKGMNTAIDADIKDMNKNLGGKMDQMLEMQGQTLEEIKGLRVDMASQHKDIKMIKSKVGLRR